MVISDAPPGGFVGVDDLGAEKDSIFNGDISLGFADERDVTGRRRDEGRLGNDWSNRRCPNMAETRRIALRNQRRDEQSM